MIRHFIIPYQPKKWIVKKISKTKKINKTRFAVLGMLFKKPRSGYDILQLMAQSTANFWQESDASIYPMLKKLEMEGKVTSRSESTGKRERTVFSITPVGKKEFLAWMALPTEQQGHRNEQLLKLFFGGHVDRKSIIKQLEVRRQMAHAELTHYKDIAANILEQLPTKDPYKLFGTLTLKYGLLHAEAEIAWTGECINLLKKK